LRRFRSLTLNQKIQLGFHTIIGGSMKTVEPQKPLARKTNLVVKEAGGEVLIYDLDTDKAHCLNQTAAMVWNAADGKRDTTAIAQHLTKKLNSTVNENVVWYALSQLSKDNLLEHRLTRPPSLGGMNRREVIRALGIAAVVAVPVVTSIVAPTPAQAATCIPTGGACTAAAQCCSGLCQGGGTCA
jgi:hypothetical protein